MYLADLNYPDFLTSCLVPADLFLCRLSIYDGQKTRKVNSDYVYAVTFSAVDNNLFQPRCVVFIMIPPRLEVLLARMSILVRPGLAFARSCQYTCIGPSRAAALRPYVQILQLDKYNSVFF